MKCADQLNALHHRLKFGQIVLSALTAGGTIITLIGNDYKAKIASAILSSALLILNSVVKGYNHGEIAQKHVDAGNAVWDLRESYQSLLTDLAADRITFEAAMKRRDELQKAMGKINTTAPSTNSKAFAAAQKALKQDEEMTFSDKEIDNLLPGPLRRAKNKPE